MFLSVKWNKKSDLLLHAVLLLGGLACSSTPSKIESSESSRDATELYSSPEDSTSSAQKLLVNETSLVPTKPAEFNFKKYGFDSEDVGFIVYDPASRQVVSSHLPQAGFAPASSIKVVTSYVALKVLGPSYRFSTKLMSRGDIQNSTLTGDLLIWGNGDPVITAQDIANWVHQTKQKGIHRVIGRLMVDQSYFEARPWIIDNRNRESPYNSGFGPISAEFNQALLSWSNRRGDRYVSSVPPVPLVDGEVSRKRLPFGRRLDFSWEEGSGHSVESWTVHRRSRRAGYERVPIRQGGLYTGYLYREIGNRFELALPAPELQTPDHGEFDVLYTHRSEPLVDLVSGMLQYSNNLAAEQIHLAASRRLQGKSVTTEEALRRSSEWLSKNLGDIDWKDFQWTSASGLSDQTRISPLQMVRVLDALFAMKLPGRSFESLLTPLGWKDTGDLRLIDSEDVFRVWAKSGTMDFVSALAGSVRTRSNRLLLFALFTQDLDRRKKQSEYRKRPSRNWASRAKSLQSELLDSWLAL